jgi:hypothetical protein
MVAPGVSCAKRSADGLAQGLVPNGVLPAGGSGRWRGEEALKQAVPASAPSMASGRYSPVGRQWGRLDPMAPRWLIAEPSPGKAQQQDGWQCLLRLAAEQHRRRRGCECQLSAVHFHEMQK